MMSIEINGKRVYVYPSPLKESLDAFIGVITDRSYGRTVNVLARRLVDLEDVLGSNASLLDEAKISGLVLWRDMGVDRGLLLAIYRDKRDLLGLLEVMVSRLRRDLKPLDISNLTALLIKTVMSYKPMLGDNE